VKSNIVRTLCSSASLLMSLALLGALALATPASAQGDLQRLIDALELTDRRIQLAKDLLAASPNHQAAVEVDMAVSLQANARAAFGEARYAAAGKATFDARIHADRAIALLRGLPDPGRVEEQLQRTRELLDRARDRLANCTVPMARDLLRVALDMQARAEASYRETRYLAALQLTMSARERAHRALRLCNATESLEESVGAALQRTDEVLAHAHEVVDANGTDRARRLLANADSLQARAHAEADAGHLRLALRLTREAREQAVRAERATHAGERR
jgi:hypothetical protein